MIGLTWANCTQLTLYLRSQQGPSSFWSQPIRPGLRIYEMKANHFEERRPCLPPRHCSVVRVGRWGGGGMARGPAPWGWMGKEKNLRDQGQKSFWEQERKLSRLPSCVQVRSHNGGHGPPRGTSQPLPARPPAPTSPPRRTGEGETETLLEATMAAKTLEATTSPHRQRGGASNPLSTGFAFPSLSLSLLICK